MSELTGFFICLTAIICNLLIVCLIVYNWQDIKRSAKDIPSDLKKFFIHTFKK